MSHTPTRVPVTLSPLLVQGIVAITVTAPESINLRDEKLSTFSSRFSVSKVPPGGSVDCGKDHQRNYTTLIYTQTQQTETPQASSTRYLLRVVTVLVVISVTIVPKSSLSDSA